ncbi:DUF1727 domain-containing protein [Candidatus Beckwithbacteria bacterium]|nr:DUF1727 domain-containing protein [Candidatus Beckwithbacteria bacterium]
MGIKTGFAKLTAKVIQFLLKNLKKSRGETAPGLIALKIDPDFVKNTHQNIKNRILITGTNGKTTTTEILRKIFEDNQINFISNPSGSNLLRGIASSGLDLKKETSTVLYETDEAAFIQIAEQLEPNFIIITNLFRDQLDRYGEIDTILKKWFQVLQKIPTSTIFLNADDPSLAFLGENLKKHQLIYFGLDFKTDKKLENFADSIFCPECQKQLAYQNIIYSHLGQYNCSCGFKKPILKYKIISNKNNIIKIEYKNISSEIETKLLGNYNLYNILAAFSLGIELKLKVKNAIQNFVPAFGRQEIFEVKNKKIQIFLVKNPTGFNQTLDTLVDLNKQITLCLAINDKIADGKDISWLWDIYFNKLNKIAKKIIITGDRCLDMVLRLKYADIDQNKYELVNNKFEALKKIIKQEDKYLYLLPTYTAMWEMREMLKKI